MTEIHVHNTTTDFQSYRAARVKSLFNVDTGAEFTLDASLPIDDGQWQIGVIVGPSGSGKTSIGRQLFGGGYIYDPGANWPEDQPIIDAIGGDSFDAVTGALSAVGLGNVPSWLRPYHALSNGERFRADLARIVTQAPDPIIFDEFTSVVDRQIAKIGASAFQKAWRRTGSRVVLLSCHYDILDWLEPDWMFDVATGEYHRGRERWKRPRFTLDVVQTDWRYWPEFEPHHYLKIPRMVGAHCYVGLVDGERVCHLAVGSKNKGKQVEARACRMVVKPEWQGAGVGMRFLNAVCEAQMQGDELARLPGRKVTTIFHTSHPGLCAALRRDPRWRQLSANLYGGNKAKSKASIKRTGKSSVGAGYGGHFRAVQGFRYYGEQAA